MKKPTQSETAPIPSREKYWSELTPDQRIERLRSIVRRQESKITEQGNQLHRLSQLFDNHGHIADQVVVGVVESRPHLSGNLGGGRVESRGPAPDDVYI